MAFALYEWKRPTSHTHRSRLVTFSPPTCTTLPAGHDTHPPFTTSGNVFGGQPTHEDDPAGLEAPSPHVIQPLEDVSPSTAENVPTGQRRHTLGSCADSLAEYFPAPHLLHTDPPLEAMNVPAAQPWQADLPVVPAKVPALHG